MTATLDPAPMPSMLANEDTWLLREHCRERLIYLDIQRQPWLDFSRQVAEELLPNRLPYLLDPHNVSARGGEQNTHIVDSVGHVSLETTASGVVSGSMPASSPWFNLLVRGEFGGEDSLRVYLDECTERLTSLHNSSNTNHILPECQKEWLAFGTAAALVVEDDEDLIRLEPFTIGEYYIAEDRKGRVNVCYRKLTLTVAQLVEEFGMDRLSPSTLAAVEREDWDLPIPCTQAIEPDVDNLNPLKNPDQPWRSVYFEEASDSTQVLGVRGYSKFPVLVWRFAKLPGTAYGYGRGHDVLPHIIRLRRLIYRYGQAVAYQSEPPVTVPAGTALHDVNYLPGGKTTVFGQGKVESFFQVRLELKELAEQIEQTRQDIRDTLGSTLVASLRRITHQMTAHEADLRTAQDLTEFLPALYKLQEELLNPYIEWLFEIADQRRMLPDPPAELQGQVIDIEFQSPLARKQRQPEVDAIVKVYAVAGEISKVRQDVLDVLDPEAAIRRIAEIEGAPVGVLVPPEAVRKIREAKAKAAQAQQQAMAAQQGADVAATAAKAGPMLGAA